MPALIDKARSVAEESRDYHGRWSSDNAGGPVENEPGSKYEGAHVALPEKPWVTPPAPTGKPGRRAGGYTAVGVTNTALGDAVEHALAQHLGMRQENTTRVGPLDLRYDGNGFEVKACSTAAKEYHAKPKTNEIREKQKYARQHKIKPHTMVVVYDPKGRQLFVYSKPGIGAYRLTSPKNGWKYHGNVPLNLGGSSDPVADAGLLRQGNGKQTVTKRTVEGEARDERGRWAADAGGDYRGQHVAPDATTGSPMHDLTSGAAPLPTDIYDKKNQLQYFGTGTDQSDRESFAAVNRVHGDPTAMVQVHRALPNDSSAINPGDWVTPSRHYAEGHLDSALRGEGHVESKQVRAGDLYTNGDSINEFGWDPHSKNPPPQVYVPASVATEHPDGLTRGSSFSVNGVTVRGRPISPRDPSIPDTVYHVSPAAQKILGDGVIRAGGAGGLGGTTKDRIVSMTTNPDVAENLRSSMRTMAAVANTVGPEPERHFDRETKEWKTADPSWGPRTVAAFQQEARREGWEWGGADADIQLTTYGLGDWSNQYFSARERAHGREKRFANPLFFGVKQKDWADVDPERVGIVPIPKASLDNGALLTTFDRTNPIGLTEIRSYGDIQLPTSGTKSRMRGGGALIVKYSEEEPRDDHGRWTSTGGGGSGGGSGEGGSRSGRGPVDPSEIGSRAFSDLASGGFTIHPYRGTRPTTGYQVAMTGYTEQYPIEQLNEDVLTDAIGKFLRKHKDLLKPGGKRYLGGWVEDGKLWLEPSERLSKRSDAMKLGRDRDQIAIWDNHKNDSISTGGSGGLGDVEGDDVRASDMPTGSGQVRASQRDEEDKRPTKAMSDLVHRHGVTTANDLQPGDVLTVHDFDGSFQGYRTIEERAREDANSVDLGYRTPSGRTGTMSLAKEASIGTEGRRRYIGSERPAPDFTGVDPALRESHPQVARQIDKAVDLSRKALSPERQSRLDSLSVRTGSMHKDRYAQYRSNGKQIELNDMWMEPGDKGVLGNFSRYRTTVESGFHPPRNGYGAVTAIAVHEIGHHIADTTAVALRPVTTRLYASLQDLSGGTSGATALNLLGTQLSSYASVNIAEACAEAWSEYVCAEHPRPVARIIGGYMSGTEEGKRDADALLASLGGEQ